MNTKEALSKIANGGRFTRDSYGWHIVRKPDANGNHHHVKLHENVARALMVRGHAPELLYNAAP